MTLSAPAAAVAAVLSFAVLATWLHGYAGISCRIGQTGTLCLHTLICFRNAVHLSVLTEIVSGSEKPKWNVCVPALVVQGSDPLIAAGAVAVVVFPVAEYLFHLSSGKVLFGMHFRKNRCDHGQQPPPQRKCSCYGGGDFLKLLRGPISRVLSCVTIYLDDALLRRSSHLSGAPDQ